MTSKIINLSTIIATICTMEIVKLYSLFGPPLHSMVSFTMYTTFLNIEKTRAVFYYYMFKINLITSFKVHSKITRANFMVW